MKSIRGEVKDLNERISFKRKRLDAAEAVKNYKLCDQLSEEVAEIKKRVQLLEVELNIFYRRKKSLNTTTSTRGRATVTAALLIDHVHQVLLLL